MDWLFRFVGNWKDSWEDYYVKNKWEGEGKRVEDEAKRRLGDDACIFSPKIPPSGTIPMHISCFSTSVVSSSENLSCCCRWRWETTRFESQPSPNVYSISRTTYDWAFWMFNFTLEALANWKLQTPLILSAFRSLIWLYFRALIHTRNNNRKAAMHFTKTP